MVRTPQQQPKYDDNDDITLILSFDFVSLLILDYCDFMTAIVICLFLIFLASAQVYSFHSIIQKVSTHHASLKFFDLRKSDSVFISNRLRSKSPVLNANDAECAELKKSPLKIIAPLLSFSVMVAAFVAFPVHPAFADSYLETLKTTASESGLVQSFLLIFISELGDKTFFIAALLAGT